METSKLEEPFLDTTQVDGIPTPMHSLVGERAFSLIPKKEPIKRAILIGINYTGTTSQLSGCVNDIKNVFQYLVQECGYEAANIRGYTDESHTPDDRKPTKANIESAIRWLHEPTKNPNAQVCLFMHYSGHGSWSYDSSKDESDGRDESICPLDYEKAGCINDDDLEKILVDPIAKNPNVKLTCLFDCCHSGTALDLRYDFNVQIASNNPTTRTFSMKQEKSYPATLCDVTLWSGCLDTQTSADAYIARQGQGAMTWGFLSVLRKNKTSSYKKTLAELQILLASNGYEQIPHLSSSKLLNLSTKLTF